MKTEENYSLKSLNTFGMDVKAKLFAKFTSEETLDTLARSKEWQENEPFILGGGSNILFTKDVDTLVAFNGMKGIENRGGDDDYVYLRVGAGEVWHDFVMYCIENGYGGVENLSLIPGSVGAGPMQNIGAYGVELKDVFQELEAYHMKGRYFVKFKAHECNFGYRESVFKNKFKGEFVITRVTFKLYRKPRFNTSYGAIEKEMERMGVKDLSIKAISDAVINIRTSKLPDPKVIGNAGSFFKNPVISGAQFEILKLKFPEVVSYPAGNDFKLAAGWLIEQCGWKGFREGDAGVHKDQALVIVNYGNAKGDQLFELSQRVMDSVKEKFGVELEREVNIK
jgi:UDP-N-acetylmuramate dehydrogenase